MSESVINPLDGVSSPPLTPSAPVPPGQEKGDGSGNPYSRSNAGEGTEGGAGGGMAPLPPGPEWTGGGGGESGGGAYTPGESQRGLVPPPLGSPSWSAPPGETDDSGEKFKSLLRFEQFLHIMPGVIPIQIGKSTVKFLGQEVVMTRQLCPSSCPCGSARHISSTDLRDASWFEVGRSGRSVFSFRQIMWRLFLQLVGLNLVMAVLAGPVDGIIAGTIMAVSLELIAWFLNFRSQLFFQVRRAQVITNEVVSADVPHSQLEELRSAAWTYMLWAQDFADTRTEGVPRSWERSRSSYLPCCGKDKISLWGPLLQQTSTGVDYALCGCPFWVHKYYVGTHIEKVSWVRTGWSGRKIWILYLAIALGATIDFYLKTYVVFILLFVILWLLLGKSSLDIGGEDNLRMSLRVDSNDAEDIRLAIVEAAVGFPIAHETPAFTRASDCCCAPTRITMTVFPSRLRVDYDPMLCWGCCRMEAAKTPFRSCCPRATAEAPLRKVTSVGAYETPSEFVLSLVGWLVVQFILLIAGIARLDGDAAFIFMEQILIAFLVIVLVILIQTFSRRAQVLLVGVDEPLTTEFARYGELSLARICVWGCGMENISTNIAPDFRSLVRYSRAARRRFDEATATITPPFPRLSVLRRWRRVDDDADDLIKYTSDECSATAVRMAPGAILLSSAGEGAGKV